MLVSIVTVAFNSGKTIRKTIESVLNGNIYFDEALEAYLHQKVEKVYDDVNEVFKH